MIKPGEKTKFLVRNLLKGLLWFSVLIVAFIIVKKNISINFLGLLNPIFENTPLILVVFSLSEFFFGIIPPELFMIWALREGSLGSYIFFIIIFSVIYYLAGFAGYLFGSYLNSTLYYRYIRKRFLGRYHSHLKKYGVFMILVAALTPLPYSAISMLVGSLHYPPKKYLFWALSRFLRFAGYAIIIWHAELI